MLTEQKKSLEKCCFLANKYLTVPEQTSTTVVQLTDWKLIISWNYFLYDKKPFCCMLYRHGVLLRNFVFCGISRLAINRRYIL